MLELGCVRCSMGLTYLMSVNVEGKSTIRAPPKSGVLRNVVILRS